MRWSLRATNLALAWMFSSTTRRTIARPRTTLRCWSTDPGTRALMRLSDLAIGMRVKRWFDALWGRLRRGRMSTPDNFLDTPGGRSLAWLADAPLFIDA